MELISGDVENSAQDRGLRFSYCPECPYLRLGPRDIEIEHRTPSGGMVLTRREASN